MFRDAAPSLYPNYQHPHHSQCNDSLELVPFQTSAAKCVKLVCSVQEFRCRLEEAAAQGDLAGLVSSTTPFSVAHVD